MLKAKYVKTEVHDKKTEHILYYQPKAEGLVVIFPGGGNSCNRPILHYSRKFLLDQNYDVLNISYKYMVDEADSTEVQIKQMVDAIHEAIEQVSKDNDYKKTVFITRSAGNIISNELKIQKSLTIDKCIYISPTAEATKYFDAYPGLIITGTNDHYLSDEKISGLVEKYEPNVLVLEQGTHNLENEDVEQSIDFCKTAVKRILSYVLD